MCIFVFLNEFVICRRRWDYLSFIAMIFLLLMLIMVIFLLLVGVIINQSELVIIVLLENVSNNFR